MKSGSKQAWFPMSLCPMDEFSGV